MTHTSTAEPPLLRADRDGIATLTLNRPDKRNALNLDLFLALDAQLSALENETETVGLVVLRAAGVVFSAGADLGKQARPPRPHFQMRVIERLARLPQPVVAAVQGLCFTGGLELVLAADIILAAQSARFADTHAKWALTPGWGMSQRLPRRVGGAKAREMMFTGRSYDGRAAEAMGLVNICVADDGFEAALAALEADIIGQSWHSHRGNKALLLGSEDLPLDAGLAYEATHTAGAGPDFLERIARFR
jgi:enoyl-CoA hydratase/carnithine racemase